MKEVEKRLCGVVSVDANRQLMLVDAGLLAASGVQMSLVR